MIQKQYSYGNRREKVRRLIVLFVFIIYLLLIFEGSIRKWVFPSAESILFFIRVPFVLLVYFLVVKYKMWPRMTIFLFFGLSFSVISLFLAPIQMILGEYSTHHWLLVGYGFHNYFFYIPLAFIIAENFYPADIYRLIKVTLILAILAVPLVILQFFSPPDSVWIRGFAGESRFIGLSHNMNSHIIVRPMGFFTSSVGQQLFVTSIVAFVIISWFSPVIKKQVGLNTLLLATFSLLPLIGVAIQRGLLIHILVVFLFSIFFGIITLQRKVLFNLLKVLILFVLLGILYPILFPQGYEVFYDRWVGAYLSESNYYDSNFGIFARLIYETIKFMLILEDIPLQGYLIGMGGNAISQLDWVSVPLASQQWVGTSGWAEDGLSRNMVELGIVFGLLFIFYRYAFFIWLVKRSFYSAKFTKQPIPLILIGLLMPLILFLQMTGQGTLVGYTWLFIGFCMASIRINNLQYNSSYSIKK
jgi:hypothetical protein